MNNLFYNVSRILSYNKHTCIICGDRGHGKTYGFKDRIVKQSLRDKTCRGMWVRRYKEDYRAQPIIKAFLSDWLPNNPDITSKYKFIVKGDEIHAVSEVEDIVVMEFIALAEYERAKSIPRPDTQYIVFDEFLTKGTYLKNEPFMLEDLKESVFRHRVDTARVILLSNSLSTSNPYFDALGVTNKDFTKEFIVGEDYVIHYDAFNTEWQSYKKEKSFTIFPKLHYNDYATGSKFLLDNVTSVIDIKNMHLKQSSLTILTNINEGVVNIAVDRCNKDFIVYETNRPSSYSNVPENIATLGLKELSRNTIELLRDYYLAGMLKFGSLRAKIGMWEIFSCVDARFMIQ